MPERVVNGLRYAYEVAGHGTPLLLLHGFTGSRASWRAHLPVLARQHTVVTVDLPGHGDTAAPPDPARYGMATVAADLVALMTAVLAVHMGRTRLEAEPHAGRFHLLGYSMGGRLALYLAAHYPQRIARLMLESASPGLETAAARRARQRQDDELAGWIEAHGIPAFVERWEGLPLWHSQQQLPPAARTTLRTQRLQNRPAGLANSLRGMGTGVQPSLWPHLSRLSLPVLLLAGELDEKFVHIQRQMAQILLYPTVEIVSGAGHTVHLERPLIFQQHVQAFIGAPDRPPARGTTL